MAEAGAVKVADLVVVPNEIDFAQAAMLKINPLTAWRLLHGYVRLERGDWLIQNAANSAAGRAVIQISRKLGYKTVNIVRREELIEDLRAEGGDVVLVDGEKLRDEVAEATGRAPIRLGLNAVGGESALRLANTLAAQRHDCDLWRDEFAAAADSEWIAYLQGSSFSRHLDQSMVRSRHA